MKITIPLYVYEKIPKDNQFHNITFDLAKGWFIDDIYIQPPDLPKDCMVTSDSYIAPEYDPSSSFNSKKTVES